MKEERFRRTLAFALGALIAQFLLGTAVNLFVTIPTDHSGANRPEYFGGGFKGGSFLNYHQDFSSMLMAVGFALAVSAYVALLCLSGIANRAPAL